jgi:hypothetical protein
MIEGFRAGHTIRLVLRDRAPPDRPREELLWSKDTRVFEVGPRPVSDREAGRRGGGEALTSEQGIGKEGIDKVAKICFIISIINVIFGNS